MGSDYDIVNPAKRQYLRIADFGENPRWRGLITGSEGRSLHAMAIAWLICRLRSGSSPLGNEDLGGSWSGDPVYFASDQAPPGWIGIATATPEQPDRNLSMMAEQEFEDITPLAIQELCEKDEDLGAILVERAGPIDPANRSSLLRLLVRLAREGSSTIFLALEARHGEDWEEIYEKVEQGWAGS